MQRISLAFLAAGASVVGALALGLGAGTTGDGLYGWGAKRALAQSAQVSAGEQVYRQVCASCHGDRGEGLEDAPALIGSGTQIADYRTAARLYSFTASEMPGDDPGSLSSQQYYDVVAYLLAQNGWNPSGEVVNPSTAANILLQ